MDMTKLLFDLKPECKRKAKETHTQSSEHVSPQRLVLDAELEKVTPQMPPGSCVSPQRLVPDAELEKQSHSAPVSPQRSVPSSHPGSLATSLHSSPAQLSSNDTEDVLSSHEDGYNMYKNQPVVLLDHLIVRSHAPYSMPAARAAPDSKSAQRSAPHSTSKTGKSRCIKKMQFVQYATRNLFPGSKSLNM